MQEVKRGRRAIAAALTREAILDAAGNLFTERGFEKTSIDDIARASESSNGAVYHHFSDKQGVFAELFRASQAGVFDRTMTVLAADGDAVADDVWGRIERTTTEFVRSYGDDDRARILLDQAIGVLGWQRVREIDEELWLPLIRATLTEAVESGTARRVPISAAADILFSVYCNAVLFVAAADDPAAAADDAEQVVSVLVGGMRVGTRD